MSIINNEINHAYSSWLEILIAEVCMITHPWLTEGVHSEVL